MVVKKCESSENRQPESISMKNNNENENCMSQPELDSRGAKDDIENAKMIDLERDNESAI